MTVQVTVSSLFHVGTGDEVKPAENGTVSVRVQRKATVPVFSDGKMQNSEQWQDQEVKTLANEQAVFTLHSGQRLIVEE